MKDERRRPSIALLTTVVVLAPVLYVASFGPACWINASRHTQSRVIPIVYQPLMKYLRADASRQHHTVRLVRWYARLGARADVAPYVYTEGTLHWSPLVTGFHEEGEVLP